MSGLIVGEKKNRLLLILVAAGFVLGIIFMNIGKKVLLENTGLLSESVLYEMKYAEVESNAFFFYVLLKRVGILLVLAVLSTTWLGLATTFTGALWLGASFGMLTTASLFRYGLKGILLVVVGVFPQGILYFPAALYALRLSYEFCLILYYPHRLSGVEKPLCYRKKALQFARLLGVVIIGCILEGYVNPILVSNLLKIF